MLYRAELGNALPELFSPGLYNYIAEIFHVQRQEFILKTYFHMQNDFLSCFLCLRFELVIYSP